MKAKRSYENIKTYPNIFYMKNNTIKNPKTWFDLRKFIEKLF